MITKDTFKLIGKNKYSADDLVEVDSESIQKKYHEFTTILRQHNVSGHENAFDKLVNLFLAKIVDETENPTELKFYWKGAAYDDIFSLTDRLQFLYKMGMKKFLGEDVTYIDNNDIDKAFRLFKKDATKKVILDYFRQLKFFTNNDFAFIDVHNEKLFYQNAEVLLKMTLMIQDIKLQTDRQNQFLGDLFEGFLDRGVKQSEGQFFTPMPIVKFLISSLPLEYLINENTEIPQVIDYACGAGHFLNEYANQISPFVTKKHNKNNDQALKPQKIHEYYAGITGIEKEYRLSKVAKVSAFMYGQNEIKIIYADALAKNPNIKDGSFSVLVANPPYSVKGFLETLSEEDRRQYELFEHIDNKQIASNNSIETFFVERAKQLLQPAGVAAIILPSSILSNGNIYIRMREILLKYFDIVAIAEFGSGTFGKTGTNTATLFLRRKNNKPEIAEHYQNRVDAWFEGDFTLDDEFEDLYLLKKYCEKIKIPFEDYKNLLGATVETWNEASVCNNDIFREYRNAFENSADYKNIMKKKSMTKYSDADRNAEIEKTYLSYIQNIEKEKIYYFMLASSNPQPVVIVKSPADSKAIKAFLGYEWSAAKGNEGIKYIGAQTNADSDDDSFILQNKGINQIRTPLFNPLNLSDAAKINSIIRANFNNKTCTIADDMRSFVSLACLNDMIDFSRTTFDKAIKTATEKKIEFESKYELVKIGDIIAEKGKSKIQVNQAKDNTTGRYVFFTSGENEYKYDDFLVDGKNIYMSTGGNALVKFYDGKASYSTDTYVFSAKENVEPYYIYLNILNLIDAINNHYFKGQGLKHLQKKEFKEIKIPLPPLEIQQQIIAECEKIDEEYNSSRMTFEEYKRKITQILDHLEIIVKT